MYKYPDEQCWKLLICTEVDVENRGLAIRADWALDPRTDGAMVTSFLFYRGEK
jgi:hypothetical protein